MSVDYYFNPCKECKNINCYGCRITNLEKELHSTQDKLSSAEFRIRNELEPRLKEEGRRYDLWVSTPKVLVNQLDETKEECELLYHANIQLFECNLCGGDNSSDSKFCRECGAKIKREIEE